jgi:hypothetical protein
LECGATDVGFRLTELKSRSQVLNFATLGAAMAVKHSAVYRDGEIKFASVGAMLANRAASGAIQTVASAFEESGVVSRDSIGFLLLFACAIWLALVDGPRAFGTGMINLNKLLNITKTVLGIGLGMFIPTYTLFYLMMRRHRH